MFHSIFFERVKELSQNETRERKGMHPLTLYSQNLQAVRGTAMTARVVTAEPFTYSLMQAEEILTELTTQMRSSSTQHPDDIIPDPSTQHANQLILLSPNFYRPLSCPGSYGPLELNVTMCKSQKKAPPPLATPVATA